MTNSVLLGCGLFDVFTRGELQHNKSFEKPAKQIVKSILL